MYIEIETRFLRRWQLHASLLPVPEVVWPEGQVVQEVAPAVLL